jgi:hypothetical protein
MTSSKNSSRTGAVAELMVAAHAVKHGWVPNFPVFPTDYDLLLERDGKIQRVQVKTVLYNRGRPKVCVRTRHHHYSANAFEWLVAVELNTGKIWKFEWTEITQTDNLSLANRDEDLWL